MKIEDPAVAELLSLAAMTLATTGADGAPHAAPVYFATDAELIFYFFSDPDSQHAQDLEHCPEAAAAIYPECHGWEEIRGLQLRGQARRLETGQAWEAAWQVYTAKFPFVLAMRDLIAKSEFYALRPRWIRLVDNRRGFGFKQEWGSP